MNSCILVATDGETGAIGALRMARALEERHGLQVEVLSVYEPYQLYVVGYPQVPGSAPAQFAAARTEALRAKVQAQLAGFGGEVAGWPLTLRVGRLAPTIARVSAEKKASLILLGLSRLDPLDRWFGRESLVRIAHLASAPVLAVAPDLAELPRQVVCAVDFSEFSLRAARAAAQSVGPDARLHLVHATWEPAGGGEAPVESAPVALGDYVKSVEERLEELGSELERDGDVSTRVHVLTGDPARKILRLAEQIGADLIASGSHGAGFLGRLVMGSVSSRLAHGAGCSLLIAPPAEVPSELLELTEREVLAELGMGGDLALMDASASE
jgi:nucleotide-binding universal stress UspA family protein